MDDALARQSRREPRPHFPAWRIQRFKCAANFLALAEEDTLVAPGRSARFPGIAAQRIDREGQRRPRILGDERRPRRFTAILSADRKSRSPRACRGSVSETRRGIRREGPRSAPVPLADGRSIAALRSLSALRPASSLRARQPQIVAQVRRRKIL